MRPAVLGFLVLVSCNKGAEVAEHEEHRTVTTPGGSCGLWHESTSNPPSTTIVTATCGEGLSCTGIAYVIAQPADTTGRYFQTCLPANALTCDLSGNPCPDPFVCTIGYGMPSAGACIRTCKTSSDCPDTYQMCEAGDCTVMACEINGDGGSNCWVGMHCQDGICRPD